MTNNTVPWSILFNEFPFDALWKWNKKYKDKLAIGNGIAEVQLLGLNNESTHTSNKMKRSIWLFKVYTQVYSISKIQAAFGEILFEVWTGLFLN